MAQSALRALDQAYLMGIGQGPAPARVPKTRGQTAADMLGAAAIGTTPIPIVGDITGMAADAAMYAAYPEERTMGNYAMSALGVLPLVPGVAAARAARGASPLEGTLDMSQAARMQGVEPNLLEGVYARSMDGVPVRAITGRERAAAGRQGAALIRQQPQIRASEALRQMMERGFKEVKTTQADRTIVGGASGNIGGAAFPAISAANPNYAGRVWGVGEKSTASGLINQSNPDTLWTTMLGSATQNKTNPIVFDKLKRGFVASMKQGNLSDELAGKINQNLALTFGEGVDIRDPQIFKLADTFNKRAALADVMMGQGIAPSKGGVSLGGEKSGRGVIFNPTEILIKETEPSLLHPAHGGDAPTFAAGPRLFSLEGSMEYRPDLHPGFPVLTTGKDMGVNIKPTPTEIFLPDWHKKFKEKTGRTAGYYDLALGMKGEGLPSQQLTDAYIKHLINSGYSVAGATIGLSALRNIQRDEEPQPD